MDSFQSLHNIALEPQVLAHSHIPILTFHFISFKQQGTNNE